MPCRNFSSRWWRIVRKGTSAFLNSVDRRWNLLQANKGAVALVEFLVGPIEPGVKLKLADALVASGVLLPYLTSWADVVRHVLRSVEADAAADGTSETSALLERLLNYDGVRSAMTAAVMPATEGPVLAMHFQKADTRLSLFTTLATLGTTQDITRNFVSRAFSRWMRQRADHFITGPTSGNPWAVPVEVGTTGPWFLTCACQPPTNHGTAGQIPIRLEARAEVWHGEPPPEEVP